MKRKMLYINLNMFIIIYKKMYTQYLLTPNILLYTLLIIPHVYPCLWICLNVYVSERGREKERCWCLWYYYDNCFNWLQHCLSLIYLYQHCKRPKTHFIMANKFKHKPDLLYKKIPLLLVYCYFLKSVIFILFYFSAVFAFKHNK